MSVAAGQAGARAVMAKRNKIKHEEEFRHRHGHSDFHHHHRHPHDRTQSVPTPGAASRHDFGAGGEACDPLISKSPRGESWLGSQAGRAGDEPLLSSHMKICDILQEWRSQQRALHAAQERVLDRLVCAEMEAVLEIQRWRDSGSRTPLMTPPELGASPRNSAAPGDIWRAQEGESLQFGNGVSAGAGLKGEGGFLDPRTPSERMEQASGRLLGVAAGLPTRLVSEEVIEKFEKHEEKMDFWRKTSGLHTVDKWVLNYNNHPGAWGALLMIHGAAELTGRLRTKVENYAIYSALFLSMSVALLAAPADHMVAECKGEDFEYWECQVQRHFYVWGLAAGTASHMLCIALAMSFVNALNETARDSDVYRMLSRGQGFQATLKCQYAFGVGCLADYIAVAMTLTTYGISWLEPLVIIPIIVTVCTVIFTKTSTLLFNSGSIVNYWRRDKGGSPDPDDPYELDMPSACFYEKATMNQEVWSPDCNPVHERCRDLVPRNM